MEDLRDGFRAVIIVVVTATVVLLANRQNAATVYPLKCSTTVSNNACSGRIMGVAERFQFRVDFATQRVVMLRGGMVSGLKDCTVFGETEWVCFSPLSNSSAVAHELHDGMYSETVPSSERAPVLGDTTTDRLVFVSPWRWWRVRLWS